VQLFGSLCTYELTKGIPKTDVQNQRYLATVKE